MATMLTVSFPLFGKKNKEDKHDSEPTFHTREKVARKYHTLLSSGHEWTSDVFGALATREGDRAVKHGLKVTELDEKLDVRKKKFVKETVAKAKEAGVVADIQSELSKDTSLKPKKAA